MTESIVRCHMIKQHSREQCSAEAVEPEGEILICQRHLALAMEMVNARLAAARAAKTDELRRRP